MTTETKYALTSERVEEVFMDCLYKDMEARKDAVIVMGIILNVGFHPERLEAHRQDVKVMLAELMPEFHQKTGGGWTFLNLCNDKHGRQWTSFHEIQEQLCLLGNALGLSEYLMDREMWAAMPGGVPYFMVKADANPD